MLIADDRKRCHELLLPLAARLPDICLPPQRAIKPPSRKPFALLRTIPLLPRHTMPHAIPSDSLRHVRPRGRVMARFHKTAPRWRCYPRRVHDMSPSTIHVQFSPRRRIHHIATIMTPPAYALYVTRSALMPRRRRAAAAAAMRATVHPANSRARAERPRTRRIARREMRGKICFDALRAHAPRCGVRLWWLRRHERLREARLMNPSALMSPAVAERASARAAVLREHVDAAERGACPCAYIRDPRDRGRTHAQRRTPRAVMPDIRCANRDRILFEQTRCCERHARARARRALFSTA